MNDHLTKLLDEAKAAKRRYNNRADTANHARYNQAVQTYILAYEKAREENWKSMPALILIIQACGIRSTNTVNTEVSLPIPTSYFKNVTNHGLGLD